MAVVGGGGGWERMGKEEEVRERGEREGEGRRSLWTQAPKTRFLFFEDK